MFIISLSLLEKEEKHSWHISGAWKRFTADHLAQKEMRILIKASHLLQTLSCTTPEQFRPTQNSGSSVLKFFLLDKLKLKLGSINPVINSDVVQGPRCSLVMNIICPASVKSRT